MKTTGLIPGYALALILALALPAIGQVVVKVDQKASDYSGVTLLTITNTTVTTVFSTNPSVTVGRVLHRSIQNVGTNAFFYLINSTNVSSTNFTGVVAGGAALRDGLGSIVDLSRVPWPVSLKTENGGTTASVVELTQ